MNFFNKDLNHLLKLIDYPFEQALMRHYGTELKQMAETLRKMHTWRIRIQGEQVDLLTTVIIKIYEPPKRRHYRSS